MGPPRTRTACPRLEPLPLSASYRSPILLGAILLGPEQTIHVSIGGDQLSQHSPHIGILGLKALDSDLFARLDHPRPIAVANHSARRPGLEGPAVHFAC